MSGGIYYVPSKRGKLVEMVEEAYDTEDVLHELLAEHSKLLGNSGRLRRRSGVDKVTSTMNRTRVEANR